MRVGLCDGFLLSRYAATLAMWADAVVADTGPSNATRAAVEKAQRSWAWSSYTLGNDGVCVAPLICSKPRVMPVCVYNCG